MNKLLSIVIPVKNESSFIKKCLDSVVRADFDRKQLEVIVCDGMSEDGTVSILDDYEKKYPFIKVLENSAGFTPNGLNLGIENSTGQYIMILGAHSEISINYLDECVTFLENNQEYSCVGGKLINVSESSTAKAISIAMSSKFGVGNARFRTDDYSGEVDTVAFAVYRRSLFDKIGLFNEKLIRNQDAEFNFRIRKRGFKIYMLHNIYAKYYVRSSFSKLWKQYFQYGFWKVYVNKIHNTITTWRQLFPLFYVINLFLLCGSLFVSKYLFLMSLTIFIIHGLLAFASSLLKGDNFFIFFRLILSYYILHISYGFGYLKGITIFLFFRK